MCFSEILQWFRLCFFREKSKVNKEPYFHLDN